ncbi:MAG: type II toxin-antitoxin system RelE/ParE family toxin [Candidatus Liptonbacteria bacterium]|nr:type II toxin-antitoxin system RelE/ParE family toxin [Candidatus Liptonbacteria bacterium]
MSSGWKFTFTLTGEEDLRSLDAPVQRRILGKLEWFRENFPSVVHEALGHEWHGYFKLRVGDWRVVYEMEHESHIVTIHRIALRDKVYKKPKK